MKQLPHQVEACQIPLIQDFALDVRQESQSCPQEKVLLFFRLAVPNSWATDWYYLSDQ